jgi:hypothetical protein
MTTNRQKPVWTTGQKWALAIVLALKFIIAYIIGTEQLLTNTQNSVIPPIAITVIIPVALFVLAFVLSGRFKEFVLAQDFRLLTALQLWRVLGFTFLVLYSFNVLPGLFAFPAGIGDVAISLTAAFMVAKLDRDPTYVNSSGFLGFQFLGLLDFIVALATSGLASGALPGLVSNGLTSAAMEVWPLNIFPSFIVPAFIILHLTVLLKIRDMRLRHGSSHTTLTPAN